RFDDFTRSLVASRRSAIRMFCTGIIAGLGLANTAHAQDDEELTDREAEREAREAEREAERAAREAKREAEQAAREAEREEREAEREAEQEQREEEREAASVVRDAFRRAGRSCSNGQTCGTHAPCANGYCTPIACN